VQPESPELWWDSDESAVPTILVDETTRPTNAQAITGNPGGAAKPVVCPYCGGQEPLFLAAVAFSAGIIAADYLW